MPLPFTCPHCGAFTEVEDQYLGHSGPCFSCGKTVTVPRGVGLKTSKPPVGTDGRPRPRTMVVLPLIVVGVLIFVVGIGVLTVILLPAMSTATSASHRAQCKNNLKQIGAALLQYEQKYGCFPPAYVADAAGKPMHSWRVLILPELGYQWLYDQYDFTQPWNSPPNNGLAGYMPVQYVCPTHPEAISQGETNYVVVVGQGTMFPGPKCRKMSQIRDGTSNTVVVTETKGKGISWMAPVDLEAGKISFQLNSGPGKDIGSHHAAGGVTVLMADGSTRFLLDTVPPENVEALLTIDGGEIVTSEVFEGF